MAKKKEEIPAINKKYARKKFNYKQRSGNN